MKKIKLTAIFLIVLVFSLSVMSFAVSAAPNFDGVTPEMPVVNDNESDAPPTNDDGTDSSSNDEQAENARDDDNDSDAGEWIVMGAVIAGLTVMTIAIIFMVSKNWDGKKSES